MIGNDVHAQLLARNSISADNKLRLANVACLCQNAHQSIADKVVAASGATGLAATSHVHQHIAHGRLRHLHGREATLALELRLLSG